MKKLLFFSMMCLAAMTMQAQRCAVLEFKAGVGISQSDVDGISAIFITYFRPAGYTMVERTQIDKAIDEQGFQRSSMSEGQMVRIGKILNVSKIVVGNVNIVMGQYNVDVRVINVESGTIAATEGATFTGSSYRSSMQEMARKLASQIAITSGGTVQPSAFAQSGNRIRNKVEVLYGYLKIFPKEIGTFQSEPTSVIEQINRQAQHGYNDWRLPTEEELSLMRANNYLGSGKYMTQESEYGIVLLVTDGKDCATQQAEKQAKQRQREEQERKAAEERRAAQLKAQGLVDLGLPSGTLWKDKNEAGGLYTYEQAVKKFGDNLPTKEQFQELESKCQFTWNGNGYKVTGPNGNSIVLPALGFCYCHNEDFENVGSCGYYWSFTPSGSYNAYFLGFCSSSGGGVLIRSDSRCLAHSVRLVQK